MRLASLSIKQPIFITMVLLAIALVGFLSYRAMGVELYPSMSAPMVAVTVDFPGASPEDVQNMVTKPIEKSLATMSGVDFIESNSSLGSAMIMVSFVTGYDLQVGAQQVREKLDSVERELPSGADSPVMQRGDPNSQAFMIVSMNVSGNPSAAELRQLIEQVIEPRMERVVGVASATVSGYDTENIEVNLIARRLQALAVTPSMITSALSSQNVNVPSGSITNSTQNLPVRFSAEFKNLDDIRNVIVAQHGNRSIRLENVATVSAEVEDKTSLIRVNGEDSIIMRLRSQSGANIVDAASGAHAELAALSQEYPNVDFYILTDNSTFIEDSIEDVLVTLVLGAALAFLIVLLFIRDLRNTIITVAGLPIVVLGTFAVISYLGFTLNIITLMALSLCIGLLIDDAIVVRENIFRHMEHGASPREAAEKGTGEIAFAVLAITLTLVAIFVPVAFTTGMTGSLFKQFGITVAVAVLISLFEAFTFAPLLTAFFAKPLSRQQTPRKSRREMFSKWTNVWPSITSGYKHVLSWSIHHRLVIVGVAIVLFAGSVWMLMNIDLTFFPATDEGQISIGINLKPGNSLETTDQIARAVEKVVLEQPEVEAFYTQVGGGAGMFGSSSSYQGSVAIQLVEGANTNVVLNRMRQSLGEYGSCLIFSKPSQFMGVGGLGSGPGGGVNIRMMPIQVEVRGPVDQETLESVANDVVSRMQTVSGLRDVSTSVPPQEPEIDLVVDRQRSADAGVSASGVGTTISTLVKGSVATRVDWQNQLTDVIVKLRQEDLSDPDGLLDLPIISSTGALYTLGNVASTESGTGAATLSRRNQQATIIVGANLQGRSQAEVAPDIEKALEGLDMPASVTWQFSGMQAHAQSAYASMYFALLIGLVFVYMVLASQFGSFIHPFTVMMALPLAIIGAVAAMLIANVELTVISMIGIILMLGVATKNSILLVDFVVRYRKQGRSRTEAVLEAGPVRLRPILMTSAAIILGMIPTAMAYGAAGTFRAPMAITAIGGVFTSTLLSLVVVPVFYTFMDDIVSLFSRLFHRGDTVSVPSQEVSPADETPRQDQPASDQNETTH